MLTSELVCHILGFIYYLLGFTAEGLYSLLKDVKCL